MRRLAQFLILLFIALLIIPAFLPEKTTASIERVIKQPAGIIFEDFNNLNEFSKWEPWASNDSLAVKEFFSPYKGKGAGYKWSKDNTEGIYTITESIKNELIKYKLEGFGMGKYSEMTTEFTPIDSLTTQLNWKIESGENGYFSRYFNYFTSEKLNEKLNQGFDRLEELLKTSTISTDQAKSLQPGMIVTEEFEGQKLICVQNETGLDEDEIKMATEESFGLIYSYLKDFLKIQGVENSHPVNYVNNTNIADKEIKFYSGYPITESVKPGEGMELFSIPASNTIVCIHKGDYSDINQTLARMKDYAKNNQLKIGGAYWEEYLNDPENINDKDDLLTKIYIPIKR